MHLKPPRPVTRIESAVQLPTDIEVQILAEDGNKERVKLSQIIDGKKVHFSGRRVRLLMCSGSSHA